MGLYLHQKLSLQCQGQKAILPCFSETSKATSITFGTMVFCGKVLQNIHCKATYNQSQGHIIIKNYSKQTHMRVSRALPFLFMYVCVCVYRISLSQ